MKVLLVEPNPGCLAILKRYIEGFEGGEEYVEVETHRCGLETLNFLMQTNYKPDLILVERELPILSGEKMIENAVRMKLISPLTCDYYMFIFCGIPGEEASRITRSNGNVKFITFLHKPYNRQELKSVVDKTRTRIENRIPVRSGARMFKRSNGYANNEVGRTVGIYNQAPSISTFRLGPLQSPAQCRRELERRFGLSHFRRRTSYGNVWYCRRRLPFHPVPRKRKREGKPKKNSFRDNWKIWVYVCLHLLAVLMTVVVKLFF